MVVARSVEVTRSALAWITGLPGRLVRINTMPVSGPDGFSENGAQVATVEHLLGALFAMGVDNCQIEMDSPEPPVTDGSGLVFAQLVQKAGRKEQEAEKTMAPIRELMATMPFSSDLKTVTTFAYNYLLGRIDETNPLDAEMILYSPS